MADANRAASPVVIEIPREIDTTNAEKVARQLRCAFSPGAIVIADMANTTFCDSRGTHELLRVHYLAKALDCGLRFARPSAEVMHMWLILGVDQIFALYPTLAAAKGDSNRGWAETEHSSVTNRRPPPPGSRP